MKICIRVTALFVFLLALALPSRGLAQGTAFTYQGRLNSNGAPAGGIYDLRFTIYDSTNNPGVVIAGPLTNSAVGVTNGLFTVLLDFGLAPFTNGASRWLEIGVKSNGIGSFAGLTPRQQLTPTPFALYAESASAAGLSGSIPSGSLGGTYGNAVTFNNGANAFNGTFTGQFFGSIFTGGIFTGTFLGSGAGLGDVWHTTGNFGTTPGTSFLGTSDNLPMDMRVNNTRVLRLEPDPRGLNAGNVIGGHPENQVQQPGSGGNAIGGGGYGGGGGNIILSNSAGVFIGGGSANRAGPGVSDSVIAGGIGSAIQENASRSFIGGGQDHVIAPGAINATIGGGHNNIIQTNASWSTISGGSTHRISSINGSIGGGWDNVIPAGANYATIAGGVHNSAGAYASVITGGEANFIPFASQYSFVGGGYGNIPSYVGVLVGGAYNVSSNSTAAFLGGGWGNFVQTNTTFATLTGGYSNATHTSFSFLGGGFGNTVQVFARHSVLVGGETNLVLTGADHSAIGGGSGNTIIASYGTVPGGYGNTASLYSFAAGHQAKATNDGSFVWADSTPGDFGSTSSNQFDVRATGGVFINNGPAGVNIDQANLNAGDLNYGLKFGAGSGEGIASRRVPGGNQYGLDFYTQFTPRMSIDQGGTVRIPGMVNAGSQTGTTEFPNQPGLVVRRINSTTLNTNTVVARTDVLTLERDGTAGGLRIRFPGSGNRQTIAAMGINNAGGQVNFFTTIPGGTPPGFFQVYTDAQNVHFTRISFGDPFGANHMTEVSLTRDAGDYYWIGTVTSTFNQ
jgi:hypothetical protein